DANGPTADIARLGKLRCSNCLSAHVRHLILWHPRRSGDRVRRREFITLLGGAAVGRSLAASAQTQPKIPRVGCVFAHTPTIDKDVFEAFRRALRELGYVEGQTIVLEARWAEDGRACRSQCGCPGGGEHPRIGGGQECYPDH